MTLKDFFSSVTNHSRLSLIVRCYSANKYTQQNKYVHFVVFLTL